MRITLAIVLGVLAAKLAGSFLPAIFPDASSWPFLKFLVFFAVSGAVLGKSAPAPGPKESADHGAVNPPAA